RPPPSSTLFPYTTLFRSYLLRSKEKTLDRPGVERYSKSPKALFRAGDGAGDPTKPLGLPLEVVPLKDPFAKTVGDALPVRVLFRDRKSTRLNSSHSQISY